MSTDFVFYVKTLTGEIHEVPFTSSLTIERVTEIMRSFLPDMCDWWEPHWFPLSCAEEKEEEEEEEEEDKQEVNRTLWNYSLPVLPANQETVCLVARIVPAAISCTNIWRVYDIAHGGWYALCTIVIETQGPNEREVILFDFLYKKTDQGEVYYRMYDTALKKKGVPVIDCVAEDMPSGIALLRFPIDKTYHNPYHSLYDMLWDIYSEKRNMPYEFFGPIRDTDTRVTPSDSVMESWIRQTVYVWEMAHKADVTRGLFEDTYRPEYMIQDYYDSL